MNDFIMTVYRLRHKHNDMVIVIPVIISFIITILVAPILVVFDSIPVIVKVALFVVPIPLVFAIMLLRKKLIIIRFLKIKDINGLINITEIEGNETSAWSDERVFMFGGYEEDMTLAVYNWLESLGVITTSPLNAYNVTYEKAGTTYLGIREKDIDPSHAFDINQYQNEAAHCVVLDYIVDGKIVDALWIAGMIKNGIR